MAWKRYGEDDILRLIHEVEVHYTSCMDVVSAYRAAGVSNKTITAGVANMAV
jgi:putative transposase